MLDDLGRDVAVPRAARRVVSLVPSLTEAVAVTAPGLLAGATDYCTHPAELGLPRVGGTKYPDVGALLDLGPDLVLANMEENRREDVEAIEAAGVPVWVTYPRDLPSALDSLDRMLTALGLDRPPWLARARDAWAEPPPAPEITVVVPVWRRPWVVLGGDTFAGDLLRRLGCRNLLDGTDRYPRPSLDEILALAPELVVLPDEPYAFTAADGPEAFPGIDCALVSGRHLTWGGPSLAEARTVLTDQLGAARPR
ncbi:ABC-type Fe3+-hydroxamate transport system substrate-binding protein [Allocatelliglobosispora scoriae]|uniref:ABC-type Fe3+-hydroxamate transport system substrate-binding protein n=1 Tax=Allocatelliglobosispora scoriae TaxID=643052 RepID=A0A841C4I7_9ACTN|nr:helical backbone metal receptor [Allocatelliglobosispora scoriae]MBB5873972.1 ABC-type Fe3+-hydroxamate transport system substrate-binding protein [Allocatelliglobosispora scoriae]